jgi:site-specific DNA-methyltransferase (adenine-specific)
MDKTTQKIMFSSASAEWITPQHFYEQLNRSFSFTLDPCCTEASAKCENYFTVKDNGLVQDWVGHKVFMNPPYGRGIDQWLKKAYDEGEKPQTTVVCLIPSRTDTKYWHKYCMKASEIYFVKGRLKFGMNEKNNAAPFPSAVVVFRGPPVLGMARHSVRIATMENK